MIINKILNSVTELGFKEIAQLHLKSSELAEISDISDVKMLAFV